ncbi:MAG: hypothetical protein HQL01_04180 [Nitrospirae bacterium]|nr:hypothetical protein [Nitrospirota bacterium]
MNERIAIIAILTTALLSNIPAVYVAARLFQLTKSAAMSAIIAITAALMVARQSIAISFYLMRLVIHTTGFFKP